MIKLQTEPLKVARGIAIYSQQDYNALAEKSERGISDHFQIINSYTENAISRFISQKDGYPNGIDILAGIIERIAGEMYDEAITGIPCSHDMGAFIRQYDREKIFGVAVSQEKALENTSYFFTALNRQFSGGVNLKVALKKNYIPWGYLIELNMSMSAAITLYATKQEIGF